MPQTVKRQRLYHDILVAIIAGLVGAVLTYFVQSQLAKDAEARLKEKITTELEAEKSKIYETVFNAAIETYSTKLGELVMKASGDASDKVGPERLEISGRSIVSARNELRSRLINLSNILDSEIDELEKDISELKKSPNNNAYQEKVRKTILVLAEKWPIKSESIKVEVRKLLAELGIERRRER